MSSVFAIESSCDDTSIAVVTNNNDIFSIDHITSYSQVIDHQQYHGVVPELAYRLHSQKIITLIEDIGTSIIKNCDAIAVTTDPWLPWSLIVGITVGQILSQFFHKPFISVNHIDGHICSLLLDRALSDIDVPMIVLSASGGHTTLFHITQEPQVDAYQLGPWRIKTLWTTLDDASGECFDKVSTMLWWPYPWGPWIDQQAQNGHYNDLIHYKSIMLEKGSLDFSFSGMKSQTYQLLQRLWKQWVWLTNELISDIAFQFQETMIDILISKIQIALDRTGAKSLWIVWWVSANTRLQKAVQALVDQWISYYTPLKTSYCVDNAGMIGAAWLLKISM